MKKYFLILFISVLSFSSEWKPFNDLLNNASILKPGDIIILEKRENLTSIFGHIAYVNKDLKTVDFKLYGSGIVEAPLYTLSDGNRKVKVLRYKYMDDKLLNSIENEFKNWFDKEYDVFTPLDGDEKVTYCSQFLYQLFIDGGKKINRKTKLMDISTLIVLPYDFFNSKDLYEVEF